MSSDKNQSPAPKVSSQTKEDYKGKRKMPAEEFLEVGPSHGITKENSDELIIPESSAQKQEKQLKEGKKEDTGQ